MKRIGIYWASQVRGDTTTKDAAHGAALRRVDQQAGMFGVENGIQIIRIGIKNQIGKWLITITVMIDGAQAVKFIEASSLSAIGNRIEAALNREGWRPDRFAPRNDRTPVPSESTIDNQDKV